MEPFKKRGVWCVRNGTKMLKFATEKEAKEYCGIVEPVEVVEQTKFPWYT